MKSRLLLLIALFLLIVPAGRNLSVQGSNPVFEVPELGEFYPSEIRDVLPAVQQGLNRSSAWQRFKAQYGRGWTVLWDEAVQVPESVYGQGIPLETANLDENTVENVARGFVDENRDLFGIDSRSLRTSSIVLAGNIWYAAFEQVINGVSVYRSRVDVWIHRTGVISYFGTHNLLPGVINVGQRVVSSSAALAEVADRFSETGRPNGEPAMNPVVFRDGVRAIPAWHVVYPVREPVALWNAIVDARTGRLLVTWDGVQYEDVVGNVQGIGLPTHPCDPVGQLPLKSLKVEIVGGDSAYTDENGDFIIPNAGTDPVTLTAELRGEWVNVFNDSGEELTFSGLATPGVSLPIIFNEDGVGEFDISQVNGMYHTTLVHDYVTRLIPQANIHFPIRCTMNLNSDCNAYYDGGINFFTSGGGCNNTGYETVIYHEWGHFLDDRIGGATDGGLGEGIGDMVAAYTSGQPINGYCWSGEGTRVRTSDNNRDWPAPECGGQVHCMGEIYAGFTWHLRENLIASLGEEQGIAVAEDVVFNSLFANAFSIPLQAIAAFVQDDDDGDLTNGTPHYEELCASATRHGMDCPRIVYVDIDHEPLQDTSNVSHGYSVVASIWADGPVLDPQVQYSVDGGAFHVLSMSSLGEGMYKAQIPAQPCPSQIAYFIQATDDEGHTESSPLDAPGAASHSFWVGNLVELMFDDFEVESGWTHDGTGQDDWMRRAPAGSSTDPVSAFSGTMCWGNDLGPSGWDGNYEADVNNFLESPPIDCSQADTVILSFYRWLNVEDGVFDHATISAAGEEVWRNPSGSGGDHLLESAWSLQTYDISAQAAGRSDVVVRFGMESDGGVEFGGWTLDDFRVARLDCELPESETRLTDAFDGDSATFNLGEVVFVTVLDADENSTSGSRQTVTVQVEVSGSGDRETLVLTETGNNTGMFRSVTGLPSTESDSGTVGNGRLEGAEGDQIVATYTDNDNGADVTVDTALFSSGEVTQPDAFILASYGPGISPWVREFDFSGSVTGNSFLAYKSTFSGGATLAVADILSDGRLEVVTAAGRGGGPHLRAFSLEGRPAGPSWFAYKNTFKAEIFVAAGDLNGNGKSEVITGAGKSGGPHVRVFRMDGNQAIPTASFFAYRTTFRGGVRVAAGDILGDSRAEIITGAGSGGAPHIRAFDANGKSKGVSFLAFESSHRGGVRVAVGDVDGDGKAEIVAGRDLTGSDIRVFEADGTLLSEFEAFEPGTRGVRVGCADIDGDGTEEILAGSGKSTLPRIRVFDLDGTLLFEFQAEDPLHKGGVEVAFGTR